MAAKILKKESLAKQSDGTCVIFSYRFRANMEQKYQSVSLKDIKEARNCLEVTIAHLAALLRTDEDIAYIKTALQNRKALPL